MSGYLVMVGTIQAYAGTDAREARRTFARYVDLMISGQCKEPHVTMLRDYVITSEYFRH